MSDTEHEELLADGHGVEQWQSACIPQSHSCDSSSKRERSFRHATPANRFHRPTGFLGTGGAQIDYQPSGFEVIFTILLADLDG